MPDIESHIDTVGGANFITVCDVQSAYWQVPIAKKHRHKTAFVTSKGKYVLKVLPLGIANVPWIFQRVMSLAFANSGQPSGLLVYMDDVITCSATWEAHLRLLEDVCLAPQTAGLTLKPSKIHFGPKEVQYLGHVLSADGIRMSEDRIKALIDLKTPTTIKVLRSVCNYSIISARVCNTAVHRRQQFSYDSSALSAQAGVHSIGTVPKT